jgi:hypothetical protein
MQPTLDLPPPPLLGRATPRSLVALDELGRGTSTSDGAAIAAAVLDAFAGGIKCRCGAFLPRRPPAASPAPFGAGHVTSCPQISQGSGRRLLSRLPLESPSTMACYYPP